jgi:hypothetical protein
MAAGGISSDHWFKFCPQCDPDRYATILERMMWDREDEEYRARWRDQVFDEWEKKGDKNELR